MARHVERLSVSKVKQLIAAHPQGRLIRHPDGDGLYFQLNAGGASSWILRYKTGTLTASGLAKEAYMGLGPYPRVSLAQAREKARSALDGLRSSGIDPLRQRQAEKDARKRELLQASRKMTFRLAAAELFQNKQNQWRNAKHRAQFVSTLEQYAYPEIGDMDVADITVPDVLRALNPIWETKTETATRVRSRIEAVIGYAIATQHRTTANPATWVGQLANVLPKPGKLKEIRREKEGKSKGFACLPYAEVASFMVELRAREAMAARALEWTILTAARTGMTIAAEWKEIDLKNKVWTIPAAKMKVKDKGDHRVPLPKAALALLERVGGPSAPNDPVFPGPHRKPLSNMAMATVLKRMKRTNITVHGFRSSFRDWAGDETSFPRELAEAALAHTLDETERAYRRSDALERRRKLMQAWADYCNGKQPVAGDNVVPMRSAQS